MKKLLLIISLFGVMFNQSTGLDFFGHYRDLKVGLQPTKIIYDEETWQFHIFCAGLDANYNGIKEIGDVNPSWWVCDAFPIITKFGAVKDSAYKVMDFDFGSWDFFAPFNPGIYMEDGKSLMYMQQGDRIRCYDLKLKTLTNDLVCTAKSSAILADNDKLYLSIREGNIGKVQIYDLVKKEFSYSINAGANVQKVMKYDKGLVILCEGTFGSNNSELIITDNDSVPTEFKRITLGNGANDFDIKGDLCAVAMNGSHDVTIVSLSGAVIDKTFPTETSGYNGPRNIRINESGQYVIVSTYNSDIRIYSISGTPYQTLITHGKCEGFDLQDEFYLVSSNQFIKDTYNPDSTICVFSIPQSVKDDAIAQNLKAYPNPSEDIVTIEGDLLNFENQIQFSIYSLLGEKIHSMLLDNSEASKLGFRFSAKEFGLTAGTYFVEMRSGMKKSVVKVSIK